MKERPILFTGDMVKAILEGRKTQTRRVIKPQPYLSPLGAGCWYPDSESKRRKHYGTTAHFFKGMPLDFCPYGVPGDRLWVRETHIIDEESQAVFYRATESFQFEGPWHPSIFMPRWASRITLEVVEVRVERVQEISERDCIAEGCQQKFMGSHPPPEIQFQYLWNSINGKKHPWESNPWVWVITFKRSIL